MLIFPLLTFCRIAETFITYIQRTQGAKVLGSVFLLVTQNEVRAASDMGRWVKEEKLVVFKSSNISF